MGRLFLYVAKDILRNRVLLLYALLLGLFSFGLFGLEDTASKGLLSMLNIVLMVVPLVSIVFSTIYVYNSSEFIELLLAQPLARSTIWLGFYLGLAGALSMAFLLGVGLPTLLFRPDATGMTLLGAGLLLSLAFASLSMLATVATRDKARGIGLALLLWLFFSLLFDGILMFVLFQFADYPIERYMIAISMLNPIDLCRVLVLMQLDVSALMGYTGAIFKDFFGTTAGMAASLAALLAWVVLPLFASLRLFKRKDL